MGLVDVLDVAGFILHSWKDNSMYMDLVASERHGHHSHSAILDVKIEHLLGLFVTTETLISKDYSQVDPLVTVKLNQTVKQTIDLFCSPKHLNRLHRVGVLNEEGKLVSIISQSDIVRFAAENSHLMPREKVRLEENCLIQQRCPYLSKNLQLLAL